jgi:hypothetical protein
MHTAFIGLKNGLFLLNAMSSLTLRITFSIPRISPHQDKFKHLQHPQHLYLHHLHHLFPQYNKHLLFLLLRHQLHQCSQRLSLLTPLSSLSCASSGDLPAMPGRLQPEAPDRPCPSPCPPSRGKGKAPTEPTHKSAQILQLSAKEWAIQCGEGTAGEEFDEPPSEAACCWMHPDHPHHYDSGTLATDLSSPNFAYLADCEELFKVFITESQDDPRTLSQACSCSDWSKWQSAMDHEIATLEKAGTWNTVSQPAAKNIVSSKWVFCIKCKADGSIEKYKAQLVAQGFTTLC